MSLIYLLQERHLKHKKMTALMKRFPSLESLDRLNYVLLVWGFPLDDPRHLDRQRLGGHLLGQLLVLGTAADFIGHRLACSMVRFLHGRITAGLRGKKAAFLTMFGFCVVLGYFLWGEAVFPSRHGGRFE